MSELRFMRQVLRACPLVCRRDPDRVG